MARITVGIDGSEGAVEALRWAAREAALTGATVHVVHAWSFPYPLSYRHGAALDPLLTAKDLERESELILDEALAAAAPQLGGVDVRREVLEGRPATALVHAAAGSDLLVVGSRGRGGFAGLLLGSVSQQVIGNAPCPVAVIRKAVSQAPPSA